LFEDYVIPRTESFNAPVEGAASWIKTLPALNETIIAYNDHYQRQRLRALQSVDEMIDGLVSQLEIAGKLDNTYIFYSTDNGYHISQHRMHPGKECGFGASLSTTFCSQSYSRLADTDIHIPFFIRGPGITEGSTVDTVTTHTDVSSTILSIAGVAKQLDWQKMPLGQNKTPTQRSEHAAIEYWGPVSCNFVPDNCAHSTDRCQGVPVGLYGGRADKNREAGVWENIYPNNTYKGLRLVADDYSLYYSVWCTNETELYDLKVI
jgi:N-acetylglucosamine-6-sulfatase